MEEAERAANVAFFSLPSLSRLGITLPGVQRPIGVKHPVLRVMGEIVAVFKAMGAEPEITYVDMPEAIRDRYQYFTEARMDRLRQAGYRAPFHSLEDGVASYVEWLRERT